MTVDPADDGSVTRVVVAETAWLGPGVGNSGADRLSGPVAVSVAGDRVVGVHEPARAPDAPRLTVDGVLLPGLVDHHVHTGLVDASALSRAGLTTVRDLGWIPDEIWETAAASGDGRTPGPRVLAAGPFLTAPGGYPTRQQWAPEGIAWELRGPEDAERAVGALTGHQPCTVKIALNDEAGPCPDDETLDAVVRCAHRSGLPVTAHTEGAGQAERAARAGVDQLAHTPFSERLDDRLLDRLAATTGVISTIDIHGWGADTPERRVAVDNLRGFHRRGGTVHYGTDLGNGPLPLGVNAREIAALREAGLTATDVLVAMTGGVPGAGSLAPGARADLVAVPGDPLSEPECLACATPVLKAGTPSGGGQPQAASG